MNAISDDGGAPPQWTLASPNLKVVFDPSQRTLRVTDQRCGKTWVQSPWSDSLVLDAVSQQAQSLRLTFNAPFKLSVTYALTDRSELLVTLDGETDATMEKLAFPPPFTTPDASHYLLQTDGAGVLLPADDTLYPLGSEPMYYCGGGPAMSWMGITDHRFVTGYMAIIETPYDATFETRRVDGLISFAPLWVASMGRFNYTRRARYIFFDQGGYVAQCKRYREHIWPLNQVVTLRENQQRFPAIEKILGAPHIYVWDTGREVSFARELKQAGIEKAMLLWNPNHQPYPEKNYDTHLKELGYATGSYELFTDIHPPSHHAHAFNPNIPLKRNVFPGLFEKITTRKKDGSFYVNQFGHYVCPEAVRPEMIKRVEKELRDYPHETYFVDVYQANGLYECYAPAHPLTRQQYAEAIITNFKLLQDKYGLFIGSEWGADHSGSLCVYVHGMMTLQRMWFNSEINHQGSIYYYGNWSNNSRPSIMLGSRTAPPSYLHHGINEYTRVPLYELVYHDAIVTSWRWEDGNHHCPEIWWKKDLFNILYGNAPLWSIDRDRWETFRATFIESYQRVCPWLQQICYDEMLSHRFVNADRTVQETRFSSGKRAVVNFGRTAFDFEGQTVPPQGFLTLGNT